MATMPPPAPRDVARAQRYYQRSLRPPSLVGPVVLILAGVLALLVETNRLNGFRLWDWYIRWWPLLLIGVGLLSLAESYFDRARPGLRFGGGVHGGLIALILVVAVFGYSSRGLHGLHLFGRQDRDDLFSHLLGQEHDADRTLNQSIPPNALIAIQVPHGDVTVTPSGDDQIHVQSHQVVYAANDRDAQRTLDAITPQLTVSGKNVTLRTADSNGGRADLTIEIPTGAQPTVTADHGDVTIEGLTKSGELAIGIVADKGDVKLDNLNGDVHVHMNKGDFSARAMIGDLSLEGRMDDVEVSGVQGRVTLNGDFFGSTDLAHINAPVHFHSSRTDVDAASIPGDLSIDSGDLQLNDASGPAHISTSAKDVECTVITGDLRVENGDGDISVGAVAPMGALQIHNRNGAIHLAVPEGAGFEVQATAQSGDIDSPLGLAITQNGEGHSLSGTVGTPGPRIDLKADHGDIAITRTSAFAPPAPPRPPRPPEAPSLHPPKHFHPAHGADPQPVTQ